ncbi:kelch domain-containing protein 8A [Strongylocentrotus purpuratus]|uniref:Uncharacterized protein n=1 Tax=Strongylocentrotus purpuratus TaxID=7668 RepID=A0A7M7GEL0_STRPU|nr:kelch domain-containing protein 8A [Strongylocentrotus purpuratus]
MATADATAGAIGPDSFKWEALPPMPTKRVYSSAVECNGKLYVIGGVSMHGNPLDAFEMYDPEKKKWNNRLPNLPNKRGQPAVAVVGGKIVVLGGVAGSKEASDAVDVFDTTSKKWTMGMKTLGEKIQNISTVVHNGKVITIGGMKANTSALQLCRVLNIEENVWLELPDMPTARYGAAAHIKGDVIYVLGGRNGKYPVMCLEVLDLKQSRWTKLKPLTKPRVFCSYIMTDEKFYCIGGLQADGKDFHDETEEYDVENDEWTDLDSMPHVRGDFCAGMVAGKIVVVGGMSRKALPLTEAEFLDDDKTWKPIADCPVSRGSGTSTVFQDKLVIIGGFTPEGVSSAVELLSVGSTSETAEASEASRGQARRGKGKRR